MIREMPEQTTVVICQCTKAKRTGEHAARDLYDESDYFVKQRGYAESVSDEWYIQSAKYGLLHPDDVVLDYDRHASDVQNVEAWVGSIANQLQLYVGTDATVEILGGKAYADPLTPELESRGYEVHEPLRGQGIGERKRSLKQMANRRLEGFA